MLADVHREPTGIAADGNVDCFSPPARNLPSQLQLLDQGGVLLWAKPVYVVQKPSPLADKLKKTATRGEVPLVDLQVLSEVADTLRYYGNLHRRGSWILLAATVFDYKLFLSLCCYRQGSAPFIAFVV